MLERLAALMIGLCFNATCFSHADCRMLACFHDWSLDCLVA
jgi:hypothetical protein